METTIYNTTYIHSFLRDPSKIKMRNLSEGACEFESLGLNFVRANDYILKYSRDRSCKTVWRVVSASSSGRTGWMGRMVAVDPLTFSYELKAALKKAELQAGKG